MITISTLDHTYGFLAFREFMPSATCITKNLNFQNRIALCKCPFCSQEMTVISSMKCDVINQCNHLVHIELQSGLATLCFDKKECTIFPFDETQRFIYSLSGGRNKNKIIKKLNSSNYIECLSTEWEVVIMNWLSKIGDCEYEVENSKGHKPDISWTSKNKIINITTEVKTVFDETCVVYHSLVSDFCGKVSSLIHNYTSEQCYFHINFRSNDKPPTMFPKEKFDEKLVILEEQIKKTKKDFTTNSTHTFYLEKHRVVVNFLESRVYAGLGYCPPYYNNIIINPIHNGLRKKIRQLTKDKNELLGVFLCDGNTNLLNPAIKNPDAVFDKKIIASFFSNQPLLDFVVTFSISTPVFSRLQYDFYVNNNKEVDERVYALQAFFEQNIALFSKHQDYPHSVIQKIKNTTPDVRKYFNPLQGTN